MMVCVMIKIYCKFNFEKRKKDRNGALYSHYCVAQVSQLTFIYLLRLPVTPYWP